MAKKKITADPIATHHFLMISVAEWKASPDLAACLSRGMTGGFPFTLYYIPQPMGPDNTMGYHIEYYRPQVQGAVVLNTFGMAQYGGTADLAESNQ